MPLARAPPTITTTRSSSPATVQQSIPANFGQQAAFSQPAFRPPAPAFTPPAPAFAPPAPRAPHSHSPGGFPSFGPPPPAYQPFSFPDIFNTTPSSSVTIGKAFPGASTVSSTTTTICPHPIIGDPADDTTINDATTFSDNAATTATPDDRKLRKLNITISCFGCKTTT